MSDVPYKTCSVEYSNANPKNTCQYKGRAGRHLKVEVYRTSARPDHLRHYCAVCCEVLHWEYAPVPEEAYADDY